MNVNTIADSMKAILNRKNPKGYTQCKCGMTATKLTYPLKKDEILVCSYCKPGGLYER